MAAATGTIAIASAGGSFDSADFPRFVLSDGTNSLTFVIDNDGRGLKLTGGGDASGYSSSSDLPLEDSQKTRLVVPTFDEADGAKKALLSWIPTDAGDVTSGWNSINANDSSTNALTAISTRAHYVLTDASGNTIKIGFGNSTLSSVQNNNAVEIARYSASGSPRYFVYRENSSSNNYFIRVVNIGTNAWKLSVAFWACVKHAYNNSLIDIDAKIITKLGTLEEPANTTGTYNSTEGVGVLLQAKTAGFAGNACNMMFKDPSNQLGSDRDPSVSWGYDEYTNVSTLNQGGSGFSRHSMSTPTNDQYWHTNEDSRIYFRQGTIAGSGSDASLSTANIAEAIKEMVNASILGITATRSDSTVNLTNDTSGDSGNVTITTTNAGSLFSVTGMSNAGGGGGGNGSMSKRVKISAAQIALGTTGGLSGSADDKSALVIDLDSLGAAAVDVGADSFTFIDATDGSTKKESIADLATSFAGNALAASSGVLAVQANSTSFQIASDEVQLASGVAGAGLALGSHALSVNVDDTGIEIDSDSLRLKDSGVVTAKIADDAVTKAKIAADVAGTGMEQHTDGSLRIAAAAAGNGLSGGAGSALAVNVDDSGIEINSDTLRLKDDGVTGAKLAPAVAGAALAQDGSGNLDVQVDDSSLEVNSDALRVKALGVTNAMLAGSIVASKMNNAIFEDLETLGAPTADGEFMVATGAGAFAYESGNTARTSLGLGTGDSPQFTSLILSGDLTVQGSTVTMDVANMQVEDTVIGMGKAGSTEGAAGDRGLIMHIASETNPAMFWDESEDEFAFVRTNATGSDSVITPDAYADLHVYAMDVDGGFDVAGASVLNGTLRLAGVADAAADVSADSFYFLDGDNLVKSESMADYAASIAGSALAASSGVLAVQANSTSFQIASDEVQLASGVAGAGLALASHALSVNVDDSGIEINSDTLRLKDLGVTTAKLAADAVTGAKIADDAVDSEHLAAGSVDLEHMSANSIDSDQYVDGSIDTAHIADAQITLAKMAVNSIDSDQYVDGSIDTAHIADLQITTAKLAADAVTGAKIADDAVDSEHLAAGSVDLEHMSANSIDSDQYVDGSIDTAHIADSQITLAKMAANSIDSDQYVDGSIDTAHLSADCVTADKLNDDVKGNGIQISAGVLSISQSQDVFASQTDGTTSLTLTGTPASSQAVYVFMNGLLLAEGASRDFTISGQTITLAATNAMQPDDEIVVKYINQ